MIRAREIDEARPLCLPAMLECRDGKAPLYLRPAQCSPKD
jgi:hypothetical protein